MKDRIVVLRIHQRVPSARSDFAIFDQPVLLLEAEYRSASVRAEFAIDDEPRTGIQDAV
jgi:hypothetical protein